MKKYILLTTLLLTSLISLSQTGGILVTNSNSADSSWSIFAQNSPTSVYGNRFNIFQLAKRPSSLSVRVRTFKLDSILQGRNDTNSLYMAGFNSTGEMKVFRRDSLKVSWSKILGKPTITSQVNSDWNSVSGVSQILNKPTIPVTTTDLGEGTNLYYTSGRFNTAFSGKTTTDLSEGSNLYWTPGRFNTAFSGKTTTDLSEGTNEYFTVARARGAISAGAGIGFSSGVITNTAPDQTVTISNGVGIAITGSYPNFTVANTLPVNVTNYGPSGTISVTRRWMAEVTPTTSNGYSIDISSAGFSNILNAQVIAIRNTSTVSSCPQVSIKSKTTSAIVVNITEVNTAVISILGIDVLSGLPTIFASTSGLTLYVLVEGN